MSNYILLEADEEDYNRDYEESEEFICKRDRDFSNDDHNDNEEDISFQRMINKKLNLEEDYERSPTGSIHTSVIRRSKINSDGSDKQIKPEVLVEDSEHASQVDYESDDDWPRKYKSIYGSDQHEWNNYRQPTGEVYNFLESDFYLKEFQRSLRIPEDTKNVQSFMYMGEKYNRALGKDSSKFNQSIDCLY